MVFDKNWTCGVFRICVFSEIDPKNPNFLKFNFQALHARMQQWICYHCIYLTAIIRFKFCKILIYVYKVLLKKISILSKILAFFSMAKIEILKPHISDHRHTICLKFQIWVDDVMINIYVRFKEKRSMMKFPASHLKYASIIMCIVKWIGKHGFRDKHFYEYDLVILFVSFVLYTNNLMTWTVWFHLIEFFW